MSTLHETIREWLIAYDPIWGHENMADALRAVLDIHKPYRIYDDCGHDHPQTDVKAGRAVEAREVGYVCEDGYEYLICTACCCTGHVGYLSQTEECATDHPHGKDLPYCGTVRVIAAALGVAEPAQPPVPAQAEPRVWRVTAVPDGIDTAEIGTLHRERDGRWESWYDDGDGDDADWYPSAWTGKARMGHYGYTLAEVTDQAGEA